MAPITSLLLRAFSKAACRVAFVDGQLVGGDFATVHTLERDQIAAFIGDGDAHLHTDFCCFGARACDQHIGVCDVQSFDV